MGAPKLQENPLFNKATIQAIVDGVVSTLSTMANVQVQVGKPSIEKNVSAKGEIMGMIGMVSPPLRGELVIAFPTATILEVIKSMLGESYPGITPEVRDCVGELTNMIYGSAKTTLNSLGYHFEMAIPKVLEGKVKLSVVGANPVTLLIPFKVNSQHDFFIELVVS